MAINKQDQNDIELKDLIETNDNIESDHVNSVQNLVAFSSSVKPKSMELNRRLKTFEQAISILEKKLNQSHNNFRLSVAGLSKNTQTNSSSLNQAKTHLSSLDSSYKSLNSQSELLTKKTASLGDLFEKSHKKQSASFQFLDNKLIENNNQINKEIKQIQQNIVLLEKSYKQVEAHSQQLLKNINELTQNVQNVSQEQYKKIQAVEYQLDIKTTYLENQIKQTINDQSKDLDKLENVINANENKINQELIDVNQLVNKISEEQKQQYKKIEKQLAENNIELKQSIENQEKKLKQNIQAKTTKLTEQLQSVTEENELRNEETQGVLAGLGKSISKLTDKLAKFRHQLQQKIASNHEHVISEFVQVNNKQQDADRQITHLQKDNKHLAYRVETIDENVAILNADTVQLGIKQENIQQQVAVNAKQEKFHFTSLSVSLALVIIALLSGFSYIWNNMTSENQKLLKQQSEHSLALNNQNNTLNKQTHSYQKLQQTVSEQAKTIQQKELHQQKLAVQITNLYTNLEKQKLLSDSYLQQLKSKQIKIQTDIKMVDDQVLYLNKTVGPFNDYEIGKLQDPIWLASQKENNYSIQLKNFNNTQEIFAFIEAEGYYLKHKLAYYPVKKDQKINYALVYGSFEKMEQAKKALYNLPYKLSAESKGIVSFKDIQLNL
jgi:chromosome segregation ATPase